MTSSVPNHLTFEKDVPRVSLEEVKFASDHGRRPIPETLVNLSGDEMRRIERRMVRKVDLVLL